MPGACQEAPIRVRDAVHGTLGDAGELSQQKPSAKTVPSHMEKSLEKERGLSKACSVELMDKFTGDPL